MEVKKRLKIVQVLPNNMPIPPMDYGAVERLAYELIEKLVELGHDVVVFAQKGSRCSGTLIEYPNRSVHQVPFILEHLPPDADLIHDQTRGSVIGVLKLSIPTVCTIHDQLLNEVKYPIFVSHKAREILGAGKGYYVYNGLNISEYEYSAEKEDYLLFIGAWLPHKGVEVALDIALKTGELLKIAGPIHDWAYFENNLKTIIDNSPNIIPMGVVGGTARQNLYKRAKCVLFPSLWEEPFGLVMIEAMACGTPVLALNHGAVPEVLKGFPELICNQPNEMMEKLKLKQFPTSKTLRQYVEETFSIDKMTDGYLAVYEEVLGLKER